MLIFLLSLMVPLQVTEADIQEVKEILERQETTLAQIRTLQATVTNKQSQDGGQTWKTLEMTKVLRSGRREWTLQKRYGAYYENEWREGEGIGQTLYTPDERRALAGFDPDDPPRLPLSGMDVDRIGASLNHPPAYGPFGWYNGWKAQAMLMPSSEESFLDLLDSCTIHSFGKTTDASGQPVWELELHPKGQGPVQSYQLTIAPKHGYLVTRQETAVAVEDQSYVATRQVVDFWTFDSGLEFPKTIETSTTRVPDSRFVVEVSDVEVNEPIDEDALTLEFPEGATVVDYRDQSYHLWGQGEPARSFASVDAFNDWNRQRKIGLYSDLMNRRQFPWVAIGIALVSAVGLIGLIIARRRFKQAIT